MKGVVKYGKGKGMVELQELPEPVIKEDEVLIEVKAVSVCGSDLHIYHDSHPYWPPVVLGHEFSGIIQETGKAVKGWKAGVPPKADAPQRWPTPARSPARSRRSTPSRPGKA